MTCGLGLLFRAESAACATIANELRGGMYSNAWVGGQSCQLLRWGGAAPYPMRLTNAKRGQATVEQPWSQHRRVRGHYLIGGVKVLETRS